MKIKQEMSRNRVGRKTNMETWLAVACWPVGLLHVLLSQCPSEVYFIFHFFLSIYLDHHHACHVTIKAPRGLLHYAFCLAFARKRKAGVIYYRSFSLLSLRCIAKSTKSAHAHCVLVNENREKDLWAYTEWQIPWTEYHNSRCVHGFRGPNARSIVASTDSVGRTPELSLRSRIPWTERH
jgi:hypothetical protein